MPNRIGRKHPGWTTVRDVKSKAIKPPDEEETMMATVKELKAEAEDLGIETDGLKKADLEEAIRKARFKGLRFKDVGDLDVDAIAAEVEETSAQAVAEEREESLGNVVWAYWNSVGEPIESDDVEELAAEIVRLRDDEGLGWMELAGRSGLTRGSVQKVYELGAERPASESNIGRGGRGAGGEYLTKDEDSKPKTKAKATKAKATKTKAKAKATKPKGKGKAKASKAKASTNGLIDWEEATEDEITEALEGKTVTTAKGEVEVASVLRFGKTKAGKRAIQVEDEEGDKVAITLSTVKAIA